MNDRPTGREVFVQAVADHLAGTPHANHPVQFSPAGKTDLWVCSLCRCVVMWADREDHREWHDAHVRVHDDILDEAQRYKAPPTYGGRR